MGAATGTLSTPVASNMHSRCDGAAGAQVLDQGYENVQDVLAAHREDGRLPAARNSFAAESCFDRLPRVGFETLC